MAAIKSKAVSCFPIFFAIFAAVEGRFYQMGWTRLASWEEDGEGPYAERDAVNSTIECASLCDIDPECHAFKYPVNDTTGSKTCQHAGASAACFFYTFAETVSGSGEERFTFHTADVAHNGSGISSTLSSAQSKIGWLAEAPSVWSNSYLREFAIDGNPATRYSSDRQSTQEGLHMWLQVTLDREYWVRGATLSGAAHRMANIEVRVGGTNVSGSPQDEMLCVNHLCFMTGWEDAAPVHADCANLLHGRFVTFQLYRATPGVSPVDTYLDVGELDLYVFCGKPGILECVPEQPDMCYNRNNLETREPAMATEAEKSAWVFTSSPLPDIGSPPFDVLTDGQTGGLFVDGETVGTQGMAGGVSFAWVQVDLGAARVVKAVMLYTEDVSPHRNMLFTEVRIGNVDMGAVWELGKRFCENPVCKQTGGGSTGELSNTEDCLSGPLEGRYVTVQRYDSDRDANGDPWYSAVRLSEIDVEFY